MTTFTIDNENRITAFGSPREAAGTQGESFSSQQKLVALAANWPGNRRIEVWNAISGLTPVKKFTDRKSAIRRIWRCAGSGQNSVEPGTEGRARSQGEAGQGSEYQTREG